ncbi:protein-arginine N-methyltransferase SFM1 [Ascoidea rubescens DSM 1968]|uniref:DUF431-domain-containing protein n=1 Tax=Ascoidea rubescens DSM 1968 TaxID=1344418 RepID=A0A1D2V9H3_9ASCO|nr:DUF431-domain-containing protein [Ascoidea rubescens DSM 1968]ODV58310.1 DUF431-domain-containing protein [Ascoidea rubescens DSM 1968]
MIYIIEHMESGFSDWVVLEYIKIIQEIGSHNLILTSLPVNITSNDIPSSLTKLGLQWTKKEVTQLYYDAPNNQILIDGGNDGNNSKILSLDSLSKNICLLDPASKIDLKPSDSETFQFFVFGGILGDHPPKDRTGELREKYGFSGRRLGKLQMTTDTAVRVTQLIIEKNITFDEISFIDYPEIKFNKYESTEMPFRYVLDDNNKPIFPDGMLDLIKKDTEKSLDSEDLF